MSLSGQSKVVHFDVVDANNDPLHGQAGTLTLFITKDNAAPDQVSAGAAATIRDRNSSGDNANGAKGGYSVTLQTTDNVGESLELSGVCSTTGARVIKAKWNNTEFPAIGTDTFATALQKIKLGSISGKWIKRTVGETEYIDIYNDDNTTVYATIPLLADNGGTGNPVFA